MYTKKSGFTIIELLVVTTIIAVLAVGAFISFSTAGKSARDGRRKSDLETVRQALVLYKAENSNYIANAGYDAGGYTTVAGTLTVSGFLSNPAPSDPKSTYSYTYGGTLSTFCVCAQVENSNNGNASGTNCSGSSGNYYCVRNP